MKKSTVWYIIALIGAGLMGCGGAMYGWNSHEEYIDKV